MIATGEPLALILDGLCRLVEEISTESLTTILLLDPIDNSLRHALSTRSVTATIKTNLFVEQGANDASEPPPTL